MKPLLILALALSPALMMGQKKEDILSIQRDVATLQESVKQLQRSQDEKMAALQSMLQQAVDASMKVSATVNAMQRDVDSKLNDQQGRMVGPIATLGTKFDQLAEDSRATSTNLADLTRKMAALDSKLADISSAIRTLSSQPVAPPPPPGQTTSAQVSPESAETSWQAAYRDYSSGKNELALGEFGAYAKNFPDTANAPTAQYYIGYIYYNNQQWDDAIKAFDDVLNKFPENPKSPEALYYKGVSLLKNEQRTAAATAFRDYIRRYPRGDHIDAAHKNLQTLGLGPGRSAAKKR
jgi:TolA-binding protein